MLLDLSQPRHAHVDQRLRTEPNMWFCCVRPDGRPHLTPVWFVWDGETIVVFSQPASQQVRNLAPNPNVTLALEAATNGSNIAIIEGTAVLADMASVAAAVADLDTKHADLMARMGTNGPELLAEYSQPIRVTPTRLLAW